MTFDTLGVLPLDELIAHPRLVASGNAAGVRRVDAISGRGSYLRAAPHAIGSAALDPDQRNWLDTIYRSVEQPFGTARCTVLRDAVVAGQGSVVTRDGCLVRETVTEFLANRQAPDGFAAAGEGAFRLLPAPERRVAGPVLLLKRPWWRNYGHWLVDSAATLALAARLRLLANWRIAVGAQNNAPMRQVVLDTCARLAPGVEVLEHPDDEVWTCEELFYVSPLHVPPLYKHPEGLASLRALLLRDELATPLPDRRLFVSRGAHPSRRLDNEAALIAVAESHGYEVVEPQHLDLAGQIRLFRSATCVVGVKGAALTNILFCAAGARCLLLSPGDFADPFFWDLASHAGAAYSELFGRLTSRTAPASHNPFVIDPARFAALLPR